MAPKIRGASTESTDDYLKAILELSGPDEERVASNALAHHLGIRAASVTGMLQQMGIDTPIAVGYGAGSAGNTFIHIDPSQTATSSTKETSGDKFSAFLGTIRGFV